MHAGEEPRSVLNQGLTLLSLFHIHGAELRGGGRRLPAPRSTLFPGDTWVYSRGHPAGSK